VQAQLLLGIERSRRGASAERSDFADLNDRFAKLDLDPPDGAPATLNSHVLHKEASFEASSESASSGTHARARARSA
jgi:hypothetical protein